MFALIIVSIIAGLIIGALFLAWYFYQDARNKERMYLLEKGEELHKITETQKKNKFRFVFPWLQLGVVTTGLSISFLGIAVLVKYLENDQELFKGFIITFLIGISLGLSFIINHFVSRSTRDSNG